MKTTRFRTFAALAAALMAMSATATNWTYSIVSGKHYLSDDTGWKFRIYLDQSYTYNGTKYTGTKIHQYETEGTATSLDFSTGIPAELGDIVAFDNTFYKNTGTYAKNLEEVILPETVVCIGVSTFRYCSKLATVTPLLSDSVQYVGHNAFNSCTALEGILVLGGGENGSADVAVTLDTSGYQFAKCSSLSKVSIGPGVTTLPTYCFAGNSGKGIAEVDFYGCPTWVSTTFSSGSVYKWNARQARFLVPSGDDGWIKFMNDSTKMTPWTDSELAAYQEKFGTDATIPRGITVAEGQQYVVVKEKAGSDAKPLHITGSLSGETLEIGTVTPTYGSHDDVTSDLPLAVSAEQYAEVGNTLYECTGYVLSEFEDEQWVRPVTNALRSFVYDPADNTQRQVAWLWQKVGYRPSVVFPSDCGSVSATEPWTNGYYHAGASVTYTATPAEGFTFGGWYGESLADGYFANATITVTMNGEVSLLPYFAKDWEIAEGGKSMSDGYWTIPISGTTDALTLSYPTVIPAVGLLDLSKPITGGGIIVGIAEKFLFNGINANDPILSVTEIRLPETIASIGGSAFRYLPNLVRVTPFLPDSVTYLGASAFQDDWKLASALTIGGDGEQCVTFAGSDSEGAQFRSCNAIPSVTLGEGVTNVPAWFLMYALGPTEITMLGDVQTLGKQCFRQDEDVKSQPKTLKFSSFPATCGVAPCAQWDSYKTCVYVPRGNAAWQAWMANSEEMTPWGELDEGIQAKFTANFPEMAKHPKGLSVKYSNQSSGLIFNKQWIFTWNPNPKSLTIILR